MLRYAPLILFLAIAVLIMMGVVRLCKHLKHWNIHLERLQGLLYWHIPLRLMYETYFVLAIASWHNMLGKTLDISIILSFVNLVILFAALGYICFVAAKASKITDKVELV